MDDSLLHLKLKDYILNDFHFSHLIKDPPRNYSVVVFFTDFDNPENLLVKAASKDLRNVIISYCHKHFHSNRLFFAEAHGPEFGKVLMKDLGVREYPILVNFPPRGDPGVFSLTKVLETILCKIFFFCQKYYVHFCDRMFFRFS